MKPAIDAREVITVEIGGIRVYGTHHKTRERKEEPPSGPGEENSIGILFLSAGVLPRAASGDAAVYWADCLAKSGFRSFRFDPPGLGDSDGDLSTSDFDTLVNSGACGSAVSGIVNHLVERYKLRSVIAIGHCAGAVTALYSAAANGRIKGLILLDPYFHVQPENEIQDVLVRSQWRIIRELMGDRPAQSRLRDAGMKFLSGLRSVYHHLDYVRLLPQRKSLPSTANLPLIHCWNQLISTGIPMLILQSPSSVPKPGEFDYLVHLQPPSSREGCVTVKLIEGTTHAFADRQGKEGVRKFIEQWLSEQGLIVGLPHTRPPAPQDTEHRSPELADAI